MAMSITTADNSDVDPLCGANVAVGFNDTMKDSSGLMAEAYLTNVMRSDIVANWATVTTNARVIITEYVSRFIAVNAILYDMSVFTSRIEGEDMINVHVYRMRQCEKLLKDQKTVTYIE